MIWAKALKLFAWEELANDRIVFSVTQSHKGLFFQNLTKKHLFKLLFKALEQVTFRACWNIGKNQFDQNGLLSIISTHFRYEMIMLQSMRNHFFNFWNWLLYFLFIKKPLHLKLLFVNFTFIKLNCHVDLTRIYFPK